MEERRMPRKWQPRPIVVAQPGPTINTTPLIDLLLVLIVMLILAIPAATHKMPLDLPRAGTPIGQPPAAHRLDIAASGQVSWDGRPVPDARLPAYLSQMARDPARPVLHFAADGEARYERVDQVLAVVLEAGITRLGMIGNDRFERTLDSGR
jgi:biopolymer transport protein ExbD